MARNWIRNLRLFALALTSLNMIIALLNGIDNDFEFTSKLYAFCGTALASVISALGYPTVELAEKMANVVMVSTAALQVATSEISVISHIRQYFKTVGCTLQTRIHHGPELNTTWEAWATGRLCRDPSKQMLAIGRSLGEYRKEIHAKECYTMCMYTLQAHNMRWHGFITSVPAGHLPGDTYCGGQLYYLGQCPKIDRYLGDGQAFSFQDAYSR